MVIADTLDAILQYGRAGPTTVQVDYRVTHRSLAMFRYYY